MGRVVRIDRADKKRREKITQRYTENARDRAEIRAAEIGPQADARRSRGEATDEQQRLVVELETVFAKAGDQCGVNFGERFGAVFLKLGLQALNTEFLAGRIRAFDEAVGVKREQTARLGFNRDTGKFAFGQNAERHVCRFVLHDFASARGKVQDRRVTGDAESQPFARFRQKAKRDEHVGPFERVNHFVQAWSKMRGVVAGTEQHARGAFDHTHHDAGRNAVT
jgi:hypothetical protein